MLACASFSDHLLPPLSACFSRCGCNSAGSKALQCDGSNGLCSCKTNVNDEKCSSCNVGYFNLNANNPSGCQKCFCFNKTSECQSAGGRRKRDIIFHPADWLSANSNVYLMDGQVQAVYFNATNSSLVRISAPDSYHGNRLYLMEQTIAFRLMIGSAINVNSTNRSLVINLIGSYSNKMVTFSMKNVPMNVVFTKEILISANFVEHSVRTWELQDVLFDLKKLELQFDGQPGDYGILYNVRMFSVDETSMQPFFKGVERCTCPANYTGLSCETCASG